MQQADKFSSRSTTLSKPYKSRLLLLSNQRRTKTRKDKNKCRKHTRIVVRDLVRYIVPGHRIARDNGVRTRQSADMSFLSSGVGALVCI